MRRTKEEALATRERILDAAEEVFHHNGVSQTSLADIAAAAGVTRGAIYHHFADKADLFEAMMQRVFDPVEELVAELQAEIARHGDTLQSLRTLVLSYVERLVRDARYQCIFDIAWHKCEYVGAMARIRDQHMECGNHYLDIMESALRIARAQGTIVPETDPRQAAVGLMALIDGLIVNWTLNPRMFPLERYVEGIVDTYLRGLGSGD